MATNRFRFTNERIRKFDCEAGQSECVGWDADVPALGIRKQGAAKKFIFRKKLSGQPIKMTIGSPGVWSLEAARDEARQYTMLINRGIDPRDEKERRRRERDAAERQRSRERVTLAEIWEEYVESCQSRWGGHHRKAHEKAMARPGLPRKRSSKKTVAGPLWGLREYRLSELSPEILLAWLDKEAPNRPTSLAQSYRLLHSCLSWAEERPYYQGLFDLPKLFTKSVKKAVPSQNSKADVLQREQLAAWFRGVRAMSNEKHSVLLQVILLTGFRPEHVVKLEWVDIDFHWGKATIGDKHEGRRVIGLPPFVCQLLDSLPREGEFVFHSESAELGHIWMPNTKHSEMLREVKLPHMTIGGLRRSFGTLAEWLDAPAGAIAQIQGHKPSALAEKHYRRRPLDMLKVWQTRIETWILEEAGLLGEDTDKGGPA